MLSEPNRKAVHLWLSWRIGNLYPPRPEGASLKRAGGTIKYRNCTLGIFTYAGGTPVSTRWPTHTEPDIVRMQEDVRFEADMIRILDK